MRARRTRAALVATIMSGLVIGALAVASSGVATAKSRASNRWNHVAGAHATTGSGPADRGPRDNVLYFHELFGEKFTFIDVGEKGDSPGDYGVFRDPVVRASDGVRVGTIDVQCIASYADQCRGSISLTGRGQITFDGITPLGVDPDRFAITGGTGDFAGAGGGSFKVSFPSDSFALLTIHLVWRRVPRRSWPARRRS